jgi:hypothetical protein
MSFPDHEKASESLSEVALPALAEVGEELRGHGIESEVHDGTADSGHPYVELMADLGEEALFQYRVEPREARMPVYGDRSLRNSDVYYRLDVHLYAARRVGRSRLRYSIESQAASRTTAAALKPNMGSFRTIGVPRRVSSENDPM